MHVPVLVESTSGNLEADRQGRRNRHVVTPTRGRGRAGVSPPVVGNDVVLLAVGGPMQSFAISRPRTRKAAARQAGSGPRPAQIRG